MKLYKEFIRRHINIIISRVFKKKLLKEFEQKNGSVTFLPDSSFKLVDLVQQTFTNCVLSTSLCGI